MIINSEIHKETGATVYRFTSRKVDYTVITKDNNEFTVWSDRAQGRNRFQPHGQMNVYWSPAELASRSKAFANFVQLIAA